MKDKASDLYSRTPSGKLVANYPQESDEYQKRNQELRAHLRYRLEQPQTQRDISEKKKLLDDFIAHCENEKSPLSVKELKQLMEKLDKHQMLLAVLDYRDRHLKDPTSPWPKNPTWIRRMNQAISAADNQAFSVNKFSDHFMAVHMSPFVESRTSRFLGWCLARAGKLY
jgi:hypothetical protein